MTALVRTPIERDDNYITCIWAQKVATQIYFDEYSPKVTVTLWSLAGSIEYFAQMDFNLAFNRCDM